MSLDVAYCIVPWYQVWCECNSLRHMTISSFFVTFDLLLWPSSSFKVTFILISRCTLCSCILVPSMKFLGSIEFEIWTIVLRKLKWRHNDVITHSNFMKFKTNRPRVYLSDLLNFILIKHKRAEIQGTEVNR